MTDKTNGKPPRASVQLRVVTDMDFDLDDAIEEMFESILAKDPSLDKNVEVAGHDVVEEGRFLRGPVYLDDGTYFLFEAERTVH